MVSGKPLPRVADRLGFSGFGSGGQRHYKAGMGCRVAVVVCCLGLSGLACSKKDAELERGAAPPPVVSSKPDACAGGGGRVTDALSAGFFPGKSGDYCIDPNGETRAYGESAKGTLETVCTELLDGECEVYKSFGLKRVVTLRYVDGRGSPGTVNVTVSRFASAEGAYGFFTKRVIADGDPADGVPLALAAGAAGALGTGIAYVWRGELVAELSYANELETPEQIKLGAGKALPELARQLGERLPGEALPLPAVRLLPTEKLLPMGLSYTQNDLLGVAGLGAGATGFYQDGELRYRVLGLARGDEDSAKDVMGTLKKLPLSRVQKDLGFDSVAFSTRESEGALQTEWLAGRSGSAIVIVGDEPFKLKAGSDGGGRVPADRKLALLRVALAKKAP